ncbi:LacI family DNA-binding transcriptional regulator [Silvibacterium dinghuense]|uniref:LacI family transcriptional regulator n=1 Tax=Silvibacterium dinghuense TaxID=1560006 RepID=A0A4Q1S9G9_9BACT|nr:LacI family DNA-binding transcriptional regulator [Silvibacterium dinghuense]RXS93627.1 LacI family transcriptional regulator [Silvibacterium dinghuense]GGH06221.1 LacI family transcriptional regulator [Silvibacterium dinghuense]
MTKKKSKHPTLSEVAKKAGVGTTTVSRVINGGQRVDPQTLARVQKVIESLGYMPNQAARILKGDRTRSIGFVIPSIADPFFSSCAEAAQAIARAHDSLLIVLTTQNDAHAEVESVNVLLRHRADGFILAPGNSQSQVLRTLLKRVQVPVVTLDRPMEGMPIPAVVADNFAGARMATRHLIDHGYRRIACLTGEPTLYTLHERIKGYQKEIETAGLEMILDASIKDYRSAEYAVESVLAAPNPPDALLTLKNSTTIFVFEALQKLGISVPERVALLGYDDFELAATVRPSISVVQQPIEALGRTAAELLFSRMLDGAGAEKDRGKMVELHTRLIPRASCGCRPPQN